MYIYVCIYIYISTWIYENIAPERLPYVSFPCEIFLFIYFFFLHFSFDPKSISRNHTLEDIYKIKIVFNPPSLPGCFANLAPLSLSPGRLLTAQRFGFDFGARSELRTKSFDLAFCLASLSKVFLRTSLSLVREEVLREQFLPRLICFLL